MDQGPRYRGPSRCGCLSIGPGQASTNAILSKGRSQLSHLLDRDGNLVVGNAGWSYSLDRNGQSPPNMQQEGSLESSTLQLKSPSVSALPFTSGPSIRGRFLGRSPCQQVAREINKPVSGDCMKRSGTSRSIRTEPLVQPLIYSKAPSTGSELEKEGGESFAAQEQIPLRWSINWIRRTPKRPYSS